MGDFLTPYLFIQIWSMYLDLQILLIQNFLGLKFAWPKIFLGAKLFFSTKACSGPKNFWTKNIWDLKIWDHKYVDWIIIWHKILFDKNIFGLKLFWTQNFYSVNLFGTTYFGTNEVKFFWHQILISNLIWNCIVENPLWKQKKESAKIRKKSKEQARLRKGDA